MKSKLFTLGIEEEFQIIDPETRELKSHMNQIVTEGQASMKDQVKPEMHQAVVEVVQISAKIFTRQGKRYRSSAGIYRSFQKTRALALLLREHIRSPTGKIRRLPIIRAITKY